MTLREVYPGLFVSGHTRGLAPARSQEILSAAGINQILCVAPRADTTLAELFDGSYVHSPLSDGKNIPSSHLKNMAEIAAAFLRGGGKLLVHCNAGRNRASLVATMVMREMGLTSDEAIRRIRATRDTALANPHFESYLRSLDDPRPSDRPPEPFLGENPQ